MSNGKIVQVIGAVVDVQFPRESMPKVFDALKMSNPDTTFEVQQQMGDGVVRTIAMAACITSTIPPDTKTDLRWRLRTKDTPRATELVVAKNEAVRELAFNLQKSRVYVAASDRGVATRT